MKRKINTFSKIIIAGVLCFCVSCSNNSKVDLTLIPVKSGEKWGYINKKGEYVINPQFADAGFFRDGLAKVVSVDGKTGFINTDGKYEIPAKFKNATPFSEGLAFVVSDGSYPVCIDKSGETIFSLKQAKYAVWFSEGLAEFVTTERKYGFADKTGQIVVNPQFEDAMPFSEGFAAVKQNDKWGFIDKSGKIVISSQFDAVGNFKNGKAVFYNGKQWGYIDTKGSYVINPQFDRAWDFSEGMAMITSGKTVGYIIEDGKIEINPQFDDAGPFQSGLAVIRQGDRYGYINKSGKIEINPQFDDATPFFNDLAFVKSGDRWGIIDKKGKYLVNPQFDQVKKIGDLFAVESDYYDAKAFINKFFEKAGNDKSFDGFRASSTLQKIIDHPLYDNVNASDKYTSYTYNKQKMTDDISVGKTQFHFTNPIYEIVTEYSEYYGYRYETGTKKQYKFPEKFSAIEYQFDLSGDAEDKGGAIANALKTEIEKRYNIKMETKKNQYSVCQDNNLSFVIIYGKYSLSLYVGFNKEYVQGLLTRTEYDEDAEEPAYIEEAND